MTTVLTTFTSAPSFAGWNAAEGVQAAVEAFLCCDGGALPAGMAAVLPPRLPPLAFRVEADEGVGPVLALPAVELCAWLPAWAAFSAGGGAGGRGTSARECPSVLRRAVFVKRCESWLLVPAPG